eukprot:13259314-Alexandrium_andersonii.AAC.1
MPSPHPYCAGAQASRNRRLSHAARGRAPTRAIVDSALPTRAASSGAMALPPGAKTTPNANPAEGSSVSAESSVRAARVLPHNCRLASLERMPVMASKTLHSRS